MSEPKQTKRCKWEEGPHNSTHMYYRCRNPRTHLIGKWNWPCLEKYHKGCFEPKEEEKEKDPIRCKWDHVKEIEGEIRYQCTYNGLIMGDVSIDPCGTDKSCFQSKKDESKDEISFTTFTDPKGTKWYISHDKETTIKNPFLEYKYDDLVQMIKTNNPSFVPPVSEPKETPPPTPNQDYRFSRFNVIEKVLLMMGLEAIKDKSPFQNKRIVKLFYEIEQELKEK